MNSRSIASAHHVFVAKNTTTVSTPYKTVNGSRISSAGRQRGRRSGWTERGRRV